MTKLPVVSARKVIKALERDGFYVVRQRGSHIRMKKATTKEIINVTIPLKKAVKRGTLRNIIKDADLTVEEFVDLL